MNRKVNPLRLIQGRGRTQYIHILVNKHSKENPPFSNRKYIYSGNDLFTVPRPGDEVLSGEAQQFHIEIGTSNLIRLTDLEMNIG